MDEELQELESILSEHFGRTPVNSQEELNDETPVVEPEEPEIFIATRVWDYLLQTDTADVAEENESDQDVNETGDAHDEDFGNVRSFLSDGCGCRHECHKLFNYETVVNHVLDIRALTKDEKELNVMSLLKDCEGDKTKRGKRRKRSRSEFRVEGSVVCKKTFMLFFDTGKHQLLSLQQHVREHGLTPRIHGNRGRKPRHAISYDDVMRVVHFIRNYADERGLPQPAAPRGVDNVPTVYLTSDTTKANLHKKYQISCTEAGSRVLKITAFKEIWRTCLPHIRIAGPRDDVCATCEKLRRSVMDAVTEEEKLTTTESLRSHILLAQKERDVYNDCIKKSKEAIGGPDIYVHFTFDFSQNVSLPYYSRQIGPLYFLTLRKIQIFGVRVDSIPRQLNFLIDEDQTLGLDGKTTHGPDAVLSMLDWALQNYESDAETCSIHADNCPGQNKNRYVLAYFMWRVMTGQHRLIEYHMQVPGHARCLVDSGFAHIKNRYRNHDCEILAQLTALVDQSSATNTAVSYPTWTWRKWKSFLEVYFKPVPGIMQYQYFRFDQSKPGIVVVKIQHDEEEKELQILRTPTFRFQNVECPQSVSSAGLSDERRQYLRRSVSRYVRQASKDYFFGNSGVDVLN